MSKIEHSGAMVCLYLDSPPSPNDIEHLQVLLDAYDIYVERNKERGDKVWRRVGLKGTCVQILIKAERAFDAVMRNIKPNRDHFIDGINYNAFGARQGDDFNGEWPWEGSENHEDRG